MMVYANDVAYSQQRDIVIEELIEPDKECIVITDDIQKRLAIYYQQFDTSSKCQFINYKSIDEHDLLNQDVYLLKNWYTNYLTNSDEDDLPAFARNENLTISPLLKKEHPNIALFDVSKFFKKRVHLFDIKNGFESQLPSPHFDCPSRQSEKVKSGNFAQKFEEYSCTIKFPLDSCNLSNSEELHISAKADHLTLQEIDTRLVIQVNDTLGKPYIWKSTNTKLIAYDNWFTTTFELLIPVDTIKPQSTLQVYLWTSSKKASYIDNIEVAIKKQ